MADPERSSDRRQRLLPAGLAVAALVLGSAAAAPDARAAVGAPKGGTYASSWLVPVDATFFGVHDDQALRVDPSQWGTGRMHASWCDVAPTAGTDVQEKADSLLKHTFRVNAKNDVRRLNVTLGHPATWVFQAHANAVRPAYIWYCEHALANTSFPTRASLISGPVRDAYSAYVRAVIVAADHYLEADLANRIVLQAWNEPNLANGGQVKRRIPGAARTWTQAAASLQEQERIMRQVAEALIPGRYEISSPAMYGKSNALMSAYLRAQAKKRTVDSVSLNFYTHNTTPTTTMAKWTTKAARAIRLVRAYKKLRTLPVWITETNHNLINGKPGVRSNLEGKWASAEVQEHLVEVTTAQALRLGYAGLEWYQGALDQVAVNTRAGSVGAVAAKAFLSEVSGRTLTSCRTKRTVTTCTLSGRDLTDPAIRMRWSGKGLDGVTFVHPLPALPTPAPSPTDSVGPAPSPSPSMTVGELPD